MINESHKLDSRALGFNVAREAIRQGFGLGLCAAADRDPRIVALTADLTESTRVLLFKEKFPERFFELGVAEQNLASVASGLAAMGRIPFIASYAVFSPGRNWEQVRTTICLNNQNVKIVGAHAGVSVGPDGATHQALEDIAITRVLPNLDVIVPCDALEAAKATLALATRPGPGYLRLAREKTPVITTEASPFVLGTANILWTATTPAAAIIACGQLVHTALLAAERLAKEGIETLVVNLHTIKPIDVDTLGQVAARAGAVVTAEEHQTRGGLGSAVAEVLAEHCPVPIEFVGVDDQFGQSGTPDELLAHYGLDVDAIIRATKKVIKRKHGPAGR